MDILLQQIINGLVLGSMYALVALGYTMVYGIINLINFAHGEVLMVGALVSWSVVTSLESTGWPGWVILLIGLLAAIVAWIFGAVYDGLLGKFWLAAQGKTIAGGLPLLWAADIIVASDDAIFSDPVVAFGVNGVEYFAHPWEVGHRKAKEMLFTGDAIGAQDALQLGMVNRVVPRAELQEAALEMARRIAATV